MKFNLIVLIITFLSYSCTNNKSSLIKVSTEKNIKIIDSINNNDLELIINPYRKEIKTLEKVIGYSKGSYSVRDSELESTLGNLIADILYNEISVVFKNLESKELDFALFNFGGIRGTLNKGEITQHDLFTIMPWKNSATIVKITGKKVLELVEYINYENLAHPSAGLNIVFKNNDITNISIKENEFDVSKNYYVLTSNFLQEGGDKMVFFANPIELYSLDLNLREVLIKYIQSKKEIIGKLDNRIIRLKWKEDIF